MIMQLQGKSVLVTGGTGALGRVVAAKFIERGAAVATSYLAEDEVRSLPADFRSSVDCIRANVTDDEEVCRLFQQVVGKKKPVDILINIVGGFSPARPIKETETKEWRRMLDINLNSMFFCSREFLRQLGDARYGRIISIAALPALRPTAGKGAYAVAKRGVVTLTEILGEELKGSGITANAIAPGIIKTDANSLSMPDADQSKWVLPEDIAAMILLLCSPMGDAINGACIPMFGGA
jgi:NAD(P)-dependent dehydrogenase (short-subunit alcohol dehydrogenase family)